MPIKIAGYLVDCATSERLTYAATVTKFAVEKGAKTADHIIPELPVLEFDCIISDTPIGAVAIDPSRVALGGVVLPSQDALEFFTALHEAGDVVTVVCSYGTFEDMAMTSLPMTKDVGTSKALAFSVKFEKLDIRDVQRRSSDRRAAVPNATKRKNLGAQTGVETTIGKSVVKGTIYVITFPITQREFATNGYGKPVATDISVVKNIYGVDIPRPPFDCYRVLEGRERSAEGYLTPIGKGGNAGTYEYHELITNSDANGVRRDLEGRDITTKPVPSQKSEAFKRGWWNA